MRMQTLFAFVLAFSIEVRVEAADSEYLNLQSYKPVAESPLGCLINSEFPCALLGHSETKTVISANPETQVTLVKDSAVVLLSSTEMKVLQGHAFFKTRGIYKVLTDYGNAVIQNGESWVYSQDDRYYFESVEGNLSIAGRNFDKSLRLRPGLRAWLGPVTKSGVSDSGLPDPILLKDFLTRMAQITELPRQEFLVKVNSFINRWKYAANFSSGVREALIERQIASDTEIKRRRLERQRQNRLDERRMRKLFYEKNYLDK